MHNTVHIDWHAIAQHCFAQNDTFFGIHEDIFTTWHKDIQEGIFAALPWKNRSHEPHTLERILKKIFSNNFTVQVTFFENIPTYFIFINRLSSTMLDTSALKVILKIFIPIGHQVFLLDYYDKTQCNNSYLNASQLL